MSIDAVMTNRTAQGAIAWGLSLNTFPIVAVPLYAVFARQEFKGYAEKFRDSEEEVDELTRTAMAAMAPYRLETAVDVIHIPNYHALKAIAGVSLLRGNQVDLLIDGRATFDSIIGGIGRAEEYVLVQFYIVHDDGLGRRLKDAN